MIDCRKVFDQLFKMTSAYMKTLEKLLLVKETNLHFTFYLIIHIKENIK